MSSTKTNEPIVIESGGSGEIHSVAFHPDGIHLSSASADGFRRWRLADGQEVGNQIGFMSLNAISVSRDNRWIVCGTWLGAGVWDAESQEMTVEVVEGTNVLAVDISPDSTRFATGTAVATRYGNKASIWDIVTGERLVHPLQHDGMIVGVKFSPDGERVATACRESIRVFDSYNGDQLQVITVMPAVTVQSRVTPFAWSNDGQQIFALSLDNKIKSFKVSSGIKLAESQIQDVVSIALAANGKFLAAIADRSVTFWDTSTLSQIGPVIEDTEKVWSIAVSPDCSYLATGGSYGRITIRNLSDILLDAYGPFHVTPQQQLEQPSTLGNHDKRPSDSTPEQPITEVHRKNGDEDLFGIGSPSTMPPPPFSSPYNQPLLPALYLYPLNDTFISKHIPLIDGRRVKIGCQTNSKTSPAERNGYFDSKILSKQHAEVWEENGKIFIKDTKSVNGTFINGERLSPEGVESEPFELKTDDLMEFGIDIIGDDNKTIIHHKIVARVLCMFTEEDVRDAARIERMQNMPTVPGSPAQPGTSGPERTQTEKRRQAVSTPEALGSETPQDTPQQQHEQVSIAGDLTPLTTLSSLPASGPPGEDGDDDLLEVELPSGTPAPLFSYDEPPSSVSSADPREVEVTPPHSFRTMSRLPDGRPSTSPQDACSQEHHDMPVSFGVMPVLKRWLQRFNKTNENHASDPLDQHSIQSNRPATPRSGSKSQPGANAANKRSSWFIPGQRVRRAVAKPVNWSKTGTKGTKASHPNKEASSSGQDHTDPNKTSPAQQATNDATQPSAVTGVNVTQEAGDAIVSIAFKIPAWMLCLCSRTEDGRH